MSDSAEYRRMLERERERLRAAVRALDDRSLGRSLGESISESSTYDQHPADIGTETFEREKDFGLREDHMATLRMVERALQRLEEGTYGRCEGCGRPIPEARLRAVPWTARCLECQRALEDGGARDRGRPAGEDARPAFSSFTDDSPLHPVGFDGEDAWQAVARFGTSNTPSDVPGARDYGDAYVGADEEVGTVQRVERLPDPDRRPGRRRPPAKRS